MAVRVMKRRSMNVFTPASRTRGVGHRLGEAGKFCPDRESNPDLRFRKPPFYPLNYRGEAKQTLAREVW